MGGLLSRLVPGFLDSHQAGLEDFDVGLRVTAAHSCPNFSGLLLLVQQLPETALRVTSRPKQQGTLLGVVARGTPAAAADHRRECSGDHPRDDHAPCAGTEQDHTPASSSSGSLQQSDGGDTTSGRTNTVSDNLSSLSPSTQRGRRAKPSPLRRLHRRQIQLLGWVYSGEQTRVSSGKRLRVGAGGQVSV